MTSFQSYKTKTVKQIILNQHITMILKMNSKFSYCINQHYFYSFCLIIFLRKIIYTGYHFVKYLVCSQDKKVYGFSSCHVQSN